MAKYLCTLVIKEHYELEIEADTYEEAVDIANDTDVSEFTMTNFVTQRMDVEPLEEG